MTATDPERGIFITLEGPDGAGKSGQAALLAEHIGALGRDVVLTREPGGTGLSEAVRDILLSLEVDHDPLTDALLFNAARRQLIREVILPALRSGSVVVCDRYADSTLAYQGYGSGADIEALDTVAKVATDGLRPDRTVLLDVPVEIGLARRRGGAAGDLTRFELGETFDEAFHQRVRAGFQDLAAQDPQRWRVVDGSGERDAVAEAVWSAVADLFET